MPLLTPFLFSTRFSAPSVAAVSVVMCCDYIKNTELIIQSFTELE